MTANHADFQSMPADRACGLVLIVAGALSVVGMLYHPSVGSRGMDAIRELAKEGGVANVVHTVMLLALGALVFGFSGLSARLGWQTAASRAAFIAYALGSTAMMGAAVINGFAINKVVDAFLATGSQDLELAQSWLAVLGAMSSTSAQVAVGAQAIALLLWSVALWERFRLLALGGLFASGLTATGTLGILPLSVHGYLVIVAAQATWTVAVGIQVLRGRL